MKIQFALSHAMKQLNNRLEAELLLSDVLQVTRSFLLAWPEQSLTEAQFIQYQRLIIRRIQHEPIAYLIGRKEFWSLELEVNEHTLIPRPETELLVELALNHLPAQVIDLGTGSGAIALAIAHECPHCQVLATDYSPGALEVAQRNAQRLNIPNVEFLLSDWCHQLVGRKVDLMVSNPPYIAAQDEHLTQGDVRYEPREALVGGEDGLAAISEIIRCAQAHLKEHGWLFLEHGYQQGWEVRAFFNRLGYHGVTSYRDYSGIERVTGGRVVSSI